MKIHLSILHSLALVAILASCTTSPMGDDNKKAIQEITLSKANLLDKVKGGWAGQVIGCTYGGPTEFKYNGTFISDQTPIEWGPDRMLWYYENAPGLYDDVYMDLTFVDVFEQYGLDASDSLHALAIANSKYPLWHANQAARYNLLNGIMPPASGHWKNNPHADDIDFQIEADFAGLMAPCMVNTATDIASRIGHIMNYGDGLYGGIYVASMYSLAFGHNDVEFVVTEALKTIPAESQFYQCIADVIQWHQLYPNDWKSTWFETQKKWSHDIGCPDGVFTAFNIDAKINAAYIVIGLLYGQNDFGKTIDISTRCGFDSDCNPASAAGILGTMLGYSKIPDYWKQGIDKVEDLNFVYTNMSLKKVYQTGNKQAIETILKNGGTESTDSITIKYQQPKPLPLEVSFDGMYPTTRLGIRKTMDQNTASIVLEMTGCGFVITGEARKQNHLPDAVLEMDLYLDNVLLEKIKMPTDGILRKHEVCWNFQLEEGDHIIRLEKTNIPDGYSVQVGEIIVYSTNKPPITSHL